MGNPFAFGKRSKVEGWRGEHIQIFTARGLKELLEKYNFKVEKTLGAGYPPFIGWFGDLISRFDPAHSMFIVVKARKA